MKRNQRGSKRRKQTIQVWSYEQAKNAVPYVASVMRSVREHRLDALRHRLAARRLAKKPGRPNRTTLIAQEESLRETALAEERFGQAIEELEALDIYCVDPDDCLAAIPFLHQDNLAWFIFDPFDQEPIRFWRYQDDPLETRRPLAEALAGPATMTA